MRLANFLEAAPPWKTLVLFGAAFFLRLFFAPYEGHRHDLDDFLARGEYGAHHGVTSVVDLVAETDVPAYPPLTIYQNVALAKIADSRIAALEAEYPEVAKAWARVRFKMLPVAYDMLTGLVILLVLAKWSAPPWPLAGAAAFLLNPCIFLNSAFWGQIDSIHSFFMLLAIVALGVGWSERRDSWLVAAWALFALAICSKLQSILIFPLLTVVTVMRRDVRTAILGVFAGLLCTLVAYTPFLLAKRWDYFEHVFVKSFTFYDVTQANAFNIWSLGYVAPASHKVAGLVSYERLGQLLAAAGLLWLFALLVRQVRHVSRQPDDLRKLFVAAVYGCLAPFMVLTNMHERYIAPAVTLLIVAACLEPRLRWLLIGFSLTYTLNLIFVMRQYYAQPDALAVLNASNFALRVFSALLNIGMFAWFTARLPVLLRPRAEASV
jgi:dolichyl-phosphate-mannose-protein mannosyltransferase